MDRIIKTSYNIDLEKIRKGCDTLLDLFGKHGQIGFTHTLGHSSSESVGSLKDLPLKETDFIYFDPNFQNTPFYEIYQNFPYKIGRMRLMRLQPKRCYSFHQDFNIRFHIAIKTNNDAYFYFDNKRGYHIPADGYAYCVDTTKPHTAFNSNSTDDRIHLVLDTPWLSKETFEKENECQNIK